MSHRLYRLGRYAARRPWTVIGTWLLMAGLVIGVSTMFGTELEDSFEVPGLDSAQAADLLAAAESNTAGLSALVAMTPSAEGVTFFNSAEARAEVSKVQTRDH